MDNINLTPEQIASASLLSYVGLCFPNYIAEPMHELMATALEKVEAGDIRRLIICTPPQHGKCCEENTNIHMSDGTLQKAKDVNIGSRILAYKNGKIIHSRLIAKETTEKESVKLTTKTGRELIVSTDHRMVTFDGLKEAKDIKYSDFLLTLHSEIEYNEPIDENELKFITYMLFEGMCETDKSPNRSFSTGDEIVLNDFISICNKLCINVTNTSKYDYYISYHSRNLLDKYNIRGKRCTEKRLPKQFFSMPLKQRWLFIDLMFQTDGYFAKTAGQGGITLANKELIEDIQTLLSSCGIASTKFFKPNKCSNAWVLTIGRSQLPKIYENCNLGSKRSQCAKILEKKGHSKITAFPYKIGAQLKRTRENGFRCDCCKNITREKMERMSKVYPELKKYLKMDFIYDQIKNIEYIGVQKLVHLHTSRTHTYIANDLVSHNTFLTSEFFPSWVLGRHPDWSIIAATYNQTRANEVGGKVRNKLTDQVHQIVFPKCVISKDTKSVHHVATTNEGHYYSIGVGGSVMGRSAHLVLIDDPLRGREDAESKLVREKMIDWYASSIYTRLRPDNRIIVISTRWHTNDLTGYLLKEHAQENWVVVELRAIAEEDDILNRNVGEALCPNIYSLEHLKKVKIIEGTYNWESLYQQRPIARKGGIIQYHWIENNAYENPPEEDEVEKIVISWDTAYRPDELNDPTAATVWYIVKNGYYLIDVINEKLEFYKIIKKIKFLQNKYHPTTHLIEGRASGQTIIDELKRTTTIPVIEISTKNLDKHVRLDATTGLFESGRVHFPDRAPWLIETKDQLCMFPSYKYDDITDSVSQFLNWANKPRYVRRPRNKLYWK